MNRNAPRQEIRECKHSNALSVDFGRCRAAVSYGLKAYDRRDAGTVRSQSIPIGKAAIRRTPSEAKLSEDEATADFQDYIFFSRLLTGITKQQQESVSDKFLQDSDECLAHIIGTHNGSLDNLHDASSSTSRSCCS